jgi:hypothetical protein
VWSTEHDVARGAVGQHTLDMAVLPSRVLDLPVDGVRLGVDVATLRDVTAHGPTLLVFLRHFG